MTAERILVVDDEPRYLRLIEFNLASEGYEVTRASTGEEALAATAKDHFDLVILDLMLPGIDGFETCEMIREYSSVPIIMLTARGRDEDKVKGLRIGADDYVTKPFSADELLARVAAVLRRMTISDFGASPAILELGELQIDPGRHQVTVRGEIVNLTPTEYRLLYELVSNAGRVVVQDQLVIQVWGHGYDSEVLRVTIRRLRQKLEQNPAEPSIVLNVPGIGYTIDSKDQPQP